MDKTSLIGKKYGRLTVLSFNREHRVKTERYYRYFSYWNCVCECGTRFVAERNNILAGSTRSCGCLRRERCLEARALSSRRSNEKY